jgi:hypothetical protein
MSNKKIVESVLLEETNKLLGWSDDDEEFKNYKTCNSLLKYPSIDFIYSDIQLDNDKLVNIYRYKLIKALRNYAELYELNQIPMYRAKIKRIAVLLYDIE